MDRDDKLMKAKEIYDSFLELKKLEKKLESERLQLFKEKKEIESLKDSVSYLKAKYEKSILEENSLERPELNSLKVHLFASRAEKSSLTRKVLELNSFLKFSPYVLIKYNLKTAKVKWVSKNFKSITGYENRDIYSKGIFLFLKKPILLPEIKDGMILNYPAVFKNEEDAKIDLFIHNYDDGEQCLLGFHDVSERAMDPSAIILKKTEVPS
jgi:hypothetical protein